MNIYSAMYRRIDEDGKYHTIEGCYIRGKDRTEAIKNLKERVGKIELVTCKKT